MEQWKQFTNNNYWWEIKEVRDIWPYGSMLIYRYGLE